MSASPRMAPVPGSFIPYGDLAPVLRPVLRKLLATAQWPPEYRLRILEAGSSGGLLTALVRETDLLVRSVDFADPCPATLETASERARHWPIRCQFVNASWTSLVQSAAYDLILTWDLRSSSSPAGPQAWEHLARGHQRRPGLWLAFHEVQPFTALAYEPAGQHLYQAAGGRTVWSASGWRFPAPNRESTIGCPVL